jgi:lipopolysaccharide biosynthesis regulator YciM
MKRFHLYQLVLLLILFSCDHITTEKDAIAINQQGIVLMNAGKYDSALSAFLIAVQNQKLSKDSKGTIYRNIAITYGELEKIDSAIHYSTLAAKCFRKNSFSYLVNLADVDLLKGKTDLALSGLLKAANINPGEMSVNNSLGLIYLGEYGEDYIDLEKALKYNSKAFELDNSRVIEEVLARNYYKLDDFENAQLHYTHLLREHPDMINFSLYMGMIKHKLKKTAEAEKLFAIVLAKDSSYKETIDIFKENNK